MTAGLTFQADIVQMSANLSEDDDSTVDSSTCFGFESGRSSRNDEDQSQSYEISQSSSSSNVEISFLTPTPLKKKIRRTNAQIQSDNAAKAAESSSRTTISENKLVPVTKAKITKSAEDATTSAGAFITIGEHTYPLLAPRSMWSTTEQMDLITSYKIWDDGAKLSQSKKLIPISKLWLLHIPNLMGKKFGRVRATPNNLLASSPYQSKWLAIRKKVSNYKAAQVDGREDEQPDIEGPTGGGVDENGLDDPRMIAASAVAAVRDSKRNLRYIDGVDEESMKIIKYFMDTFPQSVSGVGLMSENDLTSGAGSKREFCQMDGFRESDVQDNSTEGGDGAAKKVSKSSLIIDLTRTAVQHHEENMNFNKSNFE